MAQLDKLTMSGGFEYAQPPPERAASAGAAPGNCGLGLPSGNYIRGHTGRCSAEVEYAAWMYKLGELYRQALRCRNFFA